MSKWSFGAGDGVPVVHDLSEKKTCPRCGEVLYADMQICYGCLYDFTRSDHGPSEVAAALDEPDGIVLEEPVDLPVVLPARKPSVAAVEGAADLLDDEVTTVLDGSRPLGPRPGQDPGILVRGIDAEVFVSVPSKGICIGRSADNEVLVRDKSVSRRHLRLLPVSDGMEAIDLGSTNPARYRGAPIVSSTVIPWGEEVVLGGVKIMPQRR